MDYDTKGKKRRHRSSSNSSESEFDTEGTWLPSQPPPQYHDLTTQQIPLTINPADLQNPTSTPLPISASSQQNQPLEQPTNLSAAGSSDLQQLTQPMLPRPERMPSISQPMAQLSVAPTAAPRPTAFATQTEDTQMLDEPTALTQSPPQQQSGLLSTAGSFNVPQPEPQSSHQPRQDERGLYINPKDPNSLRIYGAVLEALHNQRQSFHTQEATEEFVTQELDVDEILDTNGSEEELARIAYILNLKIHVYDESGMNIFTATPQSGNEPLRATIHLTKDGEDYKSHTQNPLEGVNVFTAPSSATAQQQSEMTPVAGPSNAPTQQDTEWTRVQIRDQATILARAIDSIVALARATVAEQLNIRRRTF